jgi:hypothetical protein
MTGLGTREGKEGKGESGRGSETGRREEGGEEGGKGRWKGRERGQKRKDRKRAERERRESGETGKESVVRFLPKER